jgi:hypothetical protein
VLSRKTVPTHQHRLLILSASARLVSSAGRRAGCRRHGFVVFDVVFCHSVRILGLAQWTLGIIPPAQHLMRKFIRKGHRLTYRYAAWSDHAPNFPQALTFHWRPPHQHTRTSLNLSVARLKEHRQVHQFQDLFVGFILFVLYHHKVIPHTAFVNVHNSQATRHQSATKYRVRNPDHTRAISEDETIKVQRHSREWLVFPLVFSFNSSEIPPQNNLPTVQQKLWPHYYSFPTS